ncbi:hypothetical protein COLO4_28382 [Corchorus olitorius]|uniref:Uncharacterized protein n=1 Tax=Corchorus olitorius TaxID=93759 RepID=A0A1R3HLC3_9ROSI|nr:hypothetical protein COLO4_28382 [Corchorus olitorius]
MDGSSDSSRYSSGFRGGRSEKRFSAVIQAADRHSLRQWLKEHLAVKSGHVRKCEECPPEVRSEMRERMMFHPDKEDEEGLTAMRLTLGREVGESSSTQKPMRTLAEIEADELNQAIRKSLETYHEEEQCRKKLKEFGPSQGFGLK